MVLFEQCFRNLIQGLCFFLFSKYLVNVVSKTCVPINIETPTYLAKVKDAFEKNVIPINLLKFRQLHKDFTASCKML